MGELLHHRPVDLIATYGTPPTEAAKAATTTIPIVMVGVGDPVRIAGDVAARTGKARHQARAQELQPLGAEIGAEYRGRLL
jgi:hypothetical protein